MEFETEIWKAIEEDNLKQLQELLTDGADVNLSDIDTGHSLLSRAISLGYLEISQLLLDAGADVNLGNDEGYTALMYVAREGNFEAVKLLIDSGASLALTNKDGGTALSMAAEAGEKDIVEYLLPFYDIKERRYALTTLSSGIIRKQRREDKVTNAFINAVKLSKFDEVRNAIANGIDVNAFSEDGETGIHIAVSRGDLETLDILLQAGANCEIKDEIEGWTPLMTAAYYHLPEFIIRLLEGGPNANAIDEKYASTALLIAIISQSKILNDSFSFGRQTQTQALKTIHVLIEGGADIEAQDKFGNTAILIANAIEATEIVEILKKAGASETGIERATFIKAAEAGKMELVRELLDAGIDVNLANHRGQTALMLASVEGHIDTVHMLIEAGADLNINHSGTALIAAIEGGHSEVAQMLIQAGTDANLKAPQTGWTALDYAQFDCPEIVAFLKNMTATSPK